MSSMKNTCLPLFSMLMLSFNDFFRTWKQRYWIGWDYYEAGGPIFILIGGEGEENPGWLNAGALHDYAKQFNGAMFILEHR